MNTFDIFDEYGYKEDYSYLDDVINHTFEILNIKNANMSLIFIDDNKMKELNKTYRGVDRTTDVLSFALEDNNNIKLPIRELGEVYISIPKMIEQAKEFNHSEKRELSFLTCHGLLHLLGYDHTKSEEEEKIQFGLQDRVLNELNIND
ncbi:MAG: rRNA maturation RNase YbeY [Bacilli bacterium]|nr:rRNA maturation RNase YbeY [Bacilli bacterium]